NSRLKKMYEQDTYPYVGFLSEAIFSRHSYSALEILCGPTANTKTDWRYCDAGVNGPAQSLRGRIVIIGEDNPSIDRHRIVIGSVPGLLVQANHVEALLDERVFPSPPWMNYTCGFAIFVAFELALLVESIWLTVAVTFGLLAGSIVVAYFL